MKMLVAGTLAAAALALAAPSSVSAAPLGLGRDVADAAKSGTPLVAEVHYRRRYYHRRYYRPYYGYRRYYRPRYYYGGYYRPWRPRYYYGGYYHRPYGYYYRARPVFGFSFGPVGFYRW